MILSMTGYGRAELDGDTFTLIAEIRSVNSRYLNIKQRLPEAMTPLEMRLNDLLRSRLSRGTISLTIKAQPVAGALAPPVAHDVLKGYLDEIAKVKEELNIGGDVSMDTLLSLPGVVLGPADAPVDAEAVWPQVEQAVSQALAALIDMRGAEGRNTEAVLRELCEGIHAKLATISESAPLVVKRYQQRLNERVQTLLAGAGIELANEDLLKEVTMFAERSDIAEELARLQSHLQQFVEILESKKPAGRKLSFIAQEMHREANTIGAKASDVDIARDVLDVKTAIDRIREQVENIE